MKLTFKLVSTVLAAIVVLAAVNGYLAVRYEIAEFKEETNADVQRLATTLEKQITVVWRERGPEGALEMIKSVGAGESRMQIRWVYFDARPGDPFCPLTPPERFQTLLVQRRWEVERETPEGESFLHVYWPVAVDAPHRGGLEFSKSMSELDEHKRAVVYRTMTLLGATLLATVALVVVAGVRFVGRPLQALIEKTRRIGQGDLAGPVQLNSHDELAELADGLNSMCRQLEQSQEKVQEETAARLAAMDQLRHADRLRTVGRLASGIAHELGTPLNVISGRAGLIVSGKLSADEIDLSANAIRKEAGRMTTTIRQLLDFARRSTPHRASAELGKVAAQAVDLLTPLAQKHNVDMSLVPSDGPFTAHVDVDQMQQVLTNLLVNAIQAMPDGGNVQVGIDREHARPPEGVEAAKGEYYRIWVQDEGPGIPDEDVQHLFEPFFTTKDVGEGTGLGLSIAYGIVQEHGGWIDVTSEPGRGSCFSVYLPEETDK